MNYPLELLPREGYKHIDCDLSTHFLIRWTNTRDLEEIWDAGTNQIKTGHICFPAERIDDLSMSLLGIYNKQHIGLAFTEAGREKFLQYCNPDEKVGIPLFQLEFLYDDNRHYWCVPIDKLHNREFRYTRNNESLSTTCRICHTPMKWNYWHFSVRWTTKHGPLEELDDRQRKKLARKIGHAVRVLIAQFALIYEPPVSTIESSCYCRN